jgi:flavin-dependent dehydrogenase
MHRHYDVCVVGGGPAGGVAARQLAKLGLSVCVIDRGIAASGHVGVSLPPTVRTILASIDLALEDATLLRSSGALVVWGHDKRPAYRRYPEAGLTVDRPRFDALLRSAAQSAGAHIISPAVASRPVRQEDGSWRIPFRREGRHEAICARYLIDAAGRHGILRRERRSPTSRTFAIYGTWTDVTADGDESRVEASVGGWAWGTSLSESDFLAAIFVDASAIAQSGRSGIVEIYHRRLAACELLRACLHGRLRSAIRTCAASPVPPVSVCGPSHIKVGDAGLCLDPLSSQGVQRAIVSALQAAAVVNTTLRTPANAALARAFYEQRLNEAAEQDQATSAAFYRQQAEVTPTPFWISRCAGVERSDRRPASLEASPIPPTLALSSDARLGAIGALVDGLIVPQRALFHPDLAGPVAFLADCPIERILAPVRMGIGPGELENAWKALLPGESAINVLSWLLSRRILVAFTDAS